MRAYPEHDARAITAMAIREGLIRTDEPCCVCGVPQSLTAKGILGVVRHHPDIDRRPLWTIPLCVFDHQRVHNGLIPDPGTGTSRPPIARPESAAPAIEMVSPPADERRRIVLDHFPVGETRSARQLANELGWGLATVHATLRQLRLDGVVDAPIPAAGFTRISA